ncbi:MAG: S1-like domain-containing RNA-binding protein [Bacteroidetes bacterium]|nr:S1-like domain-containing RNA-binding protein [Bacteroidota bacterium]
MISIGKYNTMKVVKLVDFGVYLDGDDRGEILMPKRYVPKGTKPGDEVTAFVYMDSNDRIIATTEKPRGQVGEFACLKAVAVNQVGAFLDWGLMKDILVPFREQKLDMEEGRWYVVFIYLDEKSGRIAATAKLDKYLDNYALDVAEGDEVDLLIVNKTDLGFKAIVNSKFWGVIYENEIFRPMQTGDKLKGYIKKIRPDEKLDISLSKTGFAKIESLEDRILEKLKETGGLLRITDKSTPESIYMLFGESKKTFKRAVGVLYKKRLVTIEEEGIRLV